MVHGRGRPEPGDVRDCVDGLSLTSVVAASENQLNVLLPSPHGKDPCLRLGSFCGLVWALANLIDVCLNCSVFGCHQRKLGIFRDNRNRGITETRVVRS